ncbi:MAG TPA: pyridoxamine 5'-phosphate oxidase [Steroidobacteraceae bacterium]|nr:pyridoxamine 5'-phosphate oxidase [Steroidobacteraceae bacterium]
MRRGYHARMENLADPLPENPLKIAAAWLGEACRDAAQPNPNAMVLATVDGRGRPSARVVLCKAIDADSGAICFYTNYCSRKGRELAANPRAAVVFHWDHRHRQVRAEGRVERLGGADNDRYFASRSWQSRLGAWASRQSEPVESRHALIAAVAATARRFGIAYDGPGTPEPAAAGIEVPRPEHWGGYRLRVDAIELWVEGEFRIHDRVLWTRSDEAGGDARWSAMRLQP